MTDLQALCTATFEVRDVLGVLESELECHLAEDHGASEFPKWVHCDKNRDLVWCEVAEIL
jgi:hypothetical protein